MSEIIVPNVGESVSSGIIASWLVADGSRVSQGDMLFELETDKATMEIPASESGVVHIAADEGSEVQIGASVGSIDESAATSPALPALERDTSPEADTPTDGAKAQGDFGSAGASAQSEQGGNGSKGPQTQSGVQHSGPTAQPAQNASATAAPAKTNTGQATAARTLEDLSPAVRRLVEELGLDPALIPAADKSGRLEKADVVAFVRRAVIGGSTVSGSASGGGMGSGGQTEGHLQGELNQTRQHRQPMTNLRRRIAQKLVESKQGAAHLTTFNEVDMKAVMDMRSSFKEQFEKRHGVRLGFMSFFIAAAVKALKQYPQVNAFVDGSDIIHNDFYDIGVALSSDRGLMTPVIRDADRMSFAQIEQTILDFIQRAGNKKIMPDELMGGTFTISNGGVFGSMLSTPIPNPPQTAVLGMHSIQQRPVVRQGEIVIRPMMYLALTYDHRILDGREAIGFLKTIVEAVEDPASLLLDV